MKDLFDAQITGSLFVPKIFPAKPGIRDSTVSLVQIPRGIPLGIPLGPNAILQWRHTFPDVSLAWGGLGSWKSLFDIRNFRITAATATATTAEAIMIYTTHGSPGFTLDLQKKQENATSGLIGVYGHVGQFATALEAALARDLKIRENTKMPCTTTYKDDEDRKRMMLDYYLAVARMEIRLYHEYVASKANISDVPSRDTSAREFAEASLSRENRLDFIFPHPSSLWTALPAIPPALPRD